MDDRRLTELFRALEVGVEHDLPEPAFADALFHRLAADARPRGRLRAWNLSTPAVLATMAVAALVAVIGLAFALAGPRIGDPPAPAPSPAVWTGPVRADAASMPSVFMTPTEFETDSWSDGPDVGVGWTDLRRVLYHETEGVPQWQLELGRPPPPAETLDPEQRVIEYGLVFDVDEDGVPDYLAAFNTDAPQPGDYRVWVTDLATGDTEERVAPPYGFPIDFGYPAEGDVSQVNFAFLYGGSPSGIARARYAGTLRLYAYASTTDNGQVVAFDYAPDVGWLAPRPNPVPSPASSNVTSSPSGSGLPALSMPGMGLSEPAGDYGVTLGLYSSRGMHHVPEGGGRQTQIVFAVEDDCFAAGDGPEPVPVTIGDLDGRVVEPFSPEDPRQVLFVPQGGETTAAYALAVDDRTLCVYLSWDPTTTPEELEAARAVVESIRAEPLNSGSIRIVFTLDFGWDTG